MSRDRRYDCDAPDEVEDGYIDEDSSSSDDNTNAVNYVATSLGSPVKVLSRAVKRKALVVANPVMFVPTGRTLILKKFRIEQMTNHSIKNLKKKE